MEKRFEGIAAPPLLAEACCAMGVFDGVHRGHRFLIGSMIQQAQALDVPSVIITFDRDPDERFGAPSFKKLMTNEARIALLDRLGAARLCVIPFTPSFAAMNPQEFLAWLGSEGLPSAIHVGRGFRFGCKGAGNEDTLRKWASWVGLEVEVHDLLTLDGEPVSSSRIRRLLANGQVQEAQNLLGRSYSITAEVVHGRGEGHTFGISTANLLVPPELLAVGEGVYGGYAIVDSWRFKAAIAVGVSPTFEEATANVEVHLLDFNGNLYDQSLTIEFEAWLRPMRPFASTKDLVDTIGANIAWIRDNL